MLNFKNIMDLIKFFNTEEKCHQFLKSILWANGKKCPKCGGCNIQEYKSNFKKNRCADCKFDFSIIKGTIFDDSRLPLQKWFMAIYLLNSSKKGVSSVDLAEKIDITQKSAWFMLHRLRNSANTPFFNEPLKNEVEIDEAYLGGKAENKHMKKRIALKGKHNKAVVLGMVERGGNVKAIQVENSQSNTLQTEIYKNVEEGSTIYTDEHKAYHSISNRYNHKQVNHSVGEYVKVENREKRGDNRTAFKIHTNTIEGYWGLVKRGIYGIHHWVSKKHLQKYLNSYSFVYNTRYSANNDRFITFLENVVGNKLTYNQLIGK